MKKVNQNWWKVMDSKTQPGLTAKVVSALRWFFGAIALIGLVISLLNSSIRGILFFLIWAVILVPPTFELYSSIVSSKVTKKYRKLVTLFLLVLSFALISPADNQRPSLTSPAENISSGQSAESINSGQSAESTISATTSGTEWQFITELPSAWGGLVHPNSSFSCHIRRSKFDFYEGLSFFQINSPESMTEYRISFRYFEVNSPLTGYGPRFVGNYTAWRYSAWRNIHNPNQYLLYSPSRKRYFGIVVKDNDYEYASLRLDGRDWEFDSDAYERNDPNTRFSASDFDRWEFNTQKPHWQNRSRFKCAAETVRFDDEIRSHRFTNRYGGDVTGELTVNEMMGRD